MRAAVVLLALALVSEAALCLDAPPEIRWELAPGAAGAGPPEALALDARGARLAVGDRRGVLVGSGPGSLERTLHRGPVQDVLFLPDGSLLAATGRGLFQRDRDGRWRDRTPAPGARDVVRLASAGGLVAVATGGGAYVSRDLRGWRRLDGGLGSGAVRALAFAPGGGTNELWLVVEGDLWRVRLDGEQGVAASTRCGPPFAGQAARGLRDVFVDDSEVLALASDTLVRGDREGRRWEAWRPTLPAGSEAGRLARAFGWLWIATDRGLVRARSPEGPWRRASGAAARAEVRALVASTEQLYAAASSGLLVGRPTASRPDRGLPPPPELVPRRGPDVEAVQRAALVHLDLGPGEIRRLRRGVRRRGWLPVLDLQLGAERRRLHSDESDEVFTSGALRRLHDSDLDHTRSYEAVLSLTWDLGDTAFHQDEIDVSKEAREIIELRDDVLDEVNQLYFERVRTILELETGIHDPAAAARLHARVEELAAGLDAWTGGWFGRQLATDPVAIPEPGRGGSP